MQYYAKIKKQKDGKFLVVFPELDGCFTEGDSLTEAKVQASEALNLWLSSSCETGDAYPIPRPRRKSSADYFPIDVDPLLVPAILLKQTRMKMRLSQSSLAKELGVSVAEYASCERPVKTILPRGNLHRGALKAQGSLHKKGGIAVRVSVVKKAVGS